MRTTTRLTLLAILLLGAALACSLDFASTPESGSSQAGGGSNTSGTTPVISILEPAGGQSFPPNTAVDVRVSTDSTATSFLLNVNGRVASSKALPTGQSGPTEAILTWTTPETGGTYTLEVYAYNGSRSSTPATITITVNAAAASTSPGQTGAGCTGKVLVSQLNFRDGPGTNATRLGQFGVGELVTVIGRNADTSWYKVQRPNAQQVWVINNAQWFQTEGQCGTVPVAG